MENDALLAQKQHKVEEKPIRNSFALICSLRKKLHEVQEHRDFLQRELEKSNRRLHRVKRQNPNEADALNMRCEKLFSEKGALITRNVFLSKRVFELEAEKARVENG